MAFKTENLDELYYGQYGGCFISDAFTISCDKLYADYIALAGSPGFSGECRALAEEMAGPEVATGEVVLSGRRVRMCRLAAVPYALAGHAMVGHKTGRKKALFGPRTADEAIQAARICTRLGLSLKLHLPLALRDISALTEWLQTMGVELETRLCETFDLPEMYAFQEWVAAPDTACCLYSRSNVGAFPAPLMTTAFNAPYGNALQAHAGHPGALVAPCVSGSTALAALKPWFGTGVRLITVEVEDPAMHEELDSFCGAFTKVMRDETRDRVLAPELAYAWDEGVVERVFVPRENAAATLRQASAQGIGPLSLASAAALHRAQALEEDDMLVLCGAPRVGMCL